jgi:hypothetical protein
MRALRAASFCLVTAVAACGTSVGNPKKPKDDGGTSPTPPATASYQLPLVGVELPVDADDTASGFGLRATDEFDQRADKSVFRDARKRFDRSLKQIDGFSARLNKILEREEAEGGVVRFEGKGDDAELSGRVGPLAAGGDYAYEAVICHDGRAFLQFRWSEDGTRIELVKDFAAKTAPDEDGFSLVGRVVVVKAEAVTVDFATQGQSDSELTEHGGFGITERAVATKLASGEVTIKATGDRYAQPPADGVFTSDYYLSGRIAPRTSGTGYDSEFVAYLAGRPVLCRGGFDEEAPEYCFGRPLGKARFGSAEEFDATEAELAPIGVVKAAELGPVALEAGLGCE